MKNAIQKIYAYKNFRGTPRESVRGTPRDLRKFYEAAFPERRLPKAPSTKKAESEKE